MSIWGSFFSIEDEREWIADLKAEGIEAGVIRDGDPLPEDLDAPYVYEGSHVLPSAGDRRGGSLDLAYIPAHVPYWREAPEKADCTAEEWDKLVHEEPEGPPYPPFLRLGLDSKESETRYKGEPYVPAGHATVLLNRNHVLRLRDALSEWLTWTEDA